MLLSRHINKSNIPKIHDMDSEYHDHIEHLLANGRSANDSGPFYHHTFWEAYKGSVKGKLGGLLIGGGIGLLVGCVACLLLSPWLLAAGSTLSAGAIIGSVSVAGMLYGTHEFSEVGRVSGAVSAGLNDLEKRNQEFELAKFSDLNKKLDKIENLVEGHSAANEPNFKQPQAIPAANDANYANDISALDVTRERQANYRTTHHKDDALKDRGLFYHNVALVGAIVGIGVGLLLAGGVGGIAGATILSHMGIVEVAKDTALTTALITPQLLATSAIVFGVIGASFGISRDLFRMVFDKTDLIFKGIVDSDKGKNTKRAKAPELEQQINVAPVPVIEQAKVRTLIYPDVPESNDDNPNKKSASFWQEKNPSKHDAGFIAAASNALFQLDHTQATRH